MLATSTGNWSTSRNKQREPYVIRGISKSISKNCWNKDRPGELNKNVEGWEIKFLVLISQLLLYSTSTPLSLLYPFQFTRQFFLLIITGVPYRPMALTTEIAQTTNACVADRNLVGLDVPLDMEYLELETRTPVVLDRNSQRKWSNRWHDEPNFGFSSV